MLEAYVPAEFGVFGTTGRYTSGLFRCKQRSSGETDQDQEGEDCGEDKGVTKTQDRYHGKADHECPRGSAHEHPRLAWKTGQLPRQYGCEYKKYRDNEAEAAK